MATVLAPTLKPEVGIVRPQVQAYIGLGANLGNAKAAVLGAMDQLAAVAGVTLVRRSALYASAPIDSSGPDYVNAVVEVHTQLNAPQLLTELQRLEVLAGRERPFYNAPRTLDLDLLLFGEAHIVSPALVVPHPRMLQRAFVLRPLADIAPTRVSEAQLQAVADQAILQIAPLNNK